MINIINYDNGSISIKNPENRIVPGWSVQANIILGSLIYPIQIPKNTIAICIYIWNKLEEEL